MSSPTSTGTPQSPADEKKAISTKPHPQPDMKDFEDLIGDGKNKKKFDEATE